MAVDGCDGHRLVDRVVAGKEKGVFTGAQGTPGRIRANSSAVKDRDDLHEHAAVLLH